MDPLQRRALLKTAANPEPRHDYLVFLEARLAAPGIGDCALVLRYVPDRLILQPDGLADYLTAIEGVTWENLETLCAAILTDIADELVARFTQVRLTGPAADHGKISGHWVLLEDRQPRWENDILMARLVNI